MSDIAKKFLNHSMVNEYDTSSEDLDFRVAFGGILAYRISLMSTHLFLTSYTKRKGPLDRVACITGLKSHHVAQFKLVGLSCCPPCVESNQGKGSDSFCFMRVTLS